MELVVEVEGFPLHSLSHSLLLFTPLCLFDYSSSHLPSLELEEVVVEGVEERNPPHSCFTHSLTQSLHRLHFTCDVGILLLAHLVLETPPPQSLPTSLSPPPHSQYHL